MAESKLLEDARARFKLVREAEADQRNRENEDLRFCIPENQWDDEDRQARRGDGGKIPPRPTLSVTRLDQPKHLILNQMRTSDLGVLVHPVSEDADEDTAEMQQGMYRFIERKSRAELVRYWAFDRAVTAGRGVYRVITEYDPESPEPTDQRIMLRRILHQDGVYFDPTASEPDHADGKWAFVTTWMDKDEFKRQFPKAKGIPSDQHEWEGMRTEAPGWVREDDVLVAEYWFKEFSTEGDRETWTVKCAKVCGWDVLEKPVSWPGLWIPLIEVPGHELQPFDSERRWVGMVRNARDGQKFYNFAVSTFVEDLQVEPKAPWKAPIKAIEGYESVWQEANYRNFSVLPFNHVDEMGNPIPAPERTQIDGSRMSLAAMAMQQADQLIQASTATFEASLGRLPEQERSGRAIIALQQQANEATGGFLMNLADVAMTYEARVVLDLIPRIYDRPGRIARIVKGEKKPATPVMLNRPFITNPETGMPMPVPPEGAPQEAKVQTFDLKRGIYDVSVTIGKSHQTRLEEGQERIGELMAKRPELFMMMGDIYLDWADYPGSAEMAERMRKVIEKQMPGVLEEEDGQSTPEQLKGMVAQLQEALKMQGMEMQSMKQALETDRVKNESRERIALMDNESREQIAQLNADVKLAVEGLKGQVEELVNQRKREHDTTENELDRRHDATMEVVDAALPPNPPKSSGGEA
jgi:hypothetical protein